MHQDQVDQVLKDIYNVDITQAYGKEVGGITLRCAPYANNEVCIEARETSGRLYSETPTDITPDLMGNSVLTIVESMLEDHGTVLAVRENVFNVQLDNEKKDVALDGNNTEPDSE